MRGWHSARWGVDGLSFYLFRGQIDMVYLNKQKDKHGKKKQSDPKGSFFMESLGINEMNRQLLLSVHNQNKQTNKKFLVPVNLVT